MRRIRLTEAEQAQLAQIFKTTDDRRLHDRCQAVLMAHRGRKRKTIAQDLGVHRTTVRLWLKQYHEQGLAGLQIHWAPGQPRRIPETVAPMILAWVKDGPQHCGLARANWTYEELATLKKSPSARVCVTEQRRSAVSAGADVVYHLGGEGAPSAGGTWDNKDQVYCFAALNLVMGRLTTRLLDQPSHSKARTGHSKQQRLQAAFAVHLQEMARMYPASVYPEVVITIDHAPWHRGAGVEQVLATHPHLRLYRLPSYSPQLNVIERFWLVLRRRATHNRLFASITALRTTLRNNLSYFQTMKQKVLSLIESLRKAEKAAKLAAA